MILGWLWSLSLECKKREVRRTGVDEACKVWRPGSCTLPQTHAQTTTVFVAGDGAGAHQTWGKRGERGEGGGEEQGVKGVINLFYALARRGFYM